MKVWDKNDALNQGLGEAEVSCLKNSLQTIQKCKGERARCEFFGGELMVWLLSMKWA
jgi:hypothetical protein